MPRALLNLPDAAVLERARAGDPAAVRRVIVSSWPAIRRWALLAAGDSVVAEDAAQDAAERLVRGLERFDPSRPFGPWLRTVVRNAVVDQVRRRSRHAHRGVGHMADLPPASDPGDPGRHMDLARGARRARVAFASLTPRQREVVDLVDLGGHTPKEAADALGLSAGAVRFHLSVARKALRAHLSVSAPGLRSALEET